MNDSRINYMDFIPSSTTGFVQKSFKSCVAPNVFKFRYILIAIVITLTCLNTWSASIIPRNTRQEAVLKQDNPI